MATTVTPGGKATLVEQLRVHQQAGDKRFASVVELLENDRGERLVRFAYSTDGTTRRGPVTLRLRDVVRPAQGACQGRGARGGARRRLRPGGRLDGGRKRQSSSVDQGTEDQRPVGRAEQRIDSVLRVRHQSEDVAGGVDDAGDVGNGSVRILAGARSGARSGRSRRARASSSSSANQQPSPCLTGIVSSCPSTHRDVKGVSVCSTFRRTSRQTNDSDALGRSTPGSSPASVRI